MGRIELHPDFKDFLRLLNYHGVKYLLVGGYAVGYYGYPRATGDMDIWIETSELNAEKVVKVLSDFGISDGVISRKLFLKKDKVVRLGMPPVRIEIITTASGLDFNKSYSKREIFEINGIKVNFISLKDLKKNKQTAGRHKDMDDLEHLP